MSVIKYSVLCISSHRKNVSDKQLKSQCWSTWRPVLEWKADMAHVSICFPIPYNSISNYNPVAKKMEGSFDDHYNLQLDVFAARNISYDFVIDKGFGRKVDEDTFDGCLGYLQANKSQFILDFREYPRVTGEVAQGVIATDSGPYFSTVYQVDFNKVKYLQLSSAFYSFGWTLWVLLCFSLLIIWSTMRARRWIHGRFFRLRKKKKKKTSLLFQVVSHSLRFAHVRDRGIFNKLIFITCSFISLVVVSYFCSFIKTQLVALPDPPIFSSLQELLDKRITLSFVEGLLSGSNTHLPNQRRGDFSNFPWQNIGTEKLLWSIHVDQGPWIGIDAPRKDKYFGSRFILLTA